MDAIGLLGNQGTLLAHGQLVVHQDTQVPLRRAAFQQVRPVMAIYISINKSVCILEMFDLSFCNLLAVQMSFCVPFSHIAFQVSSWS